MARSPVSYLFIDGANLNAILRTFGNKYLRGEFPRISWPRMGQMHQKVYYYDAVPVQTPGEDDGAYAERIRPKLAELRAIELQPGFHVRSGDAIHRKRRGNEQKMVDVQLAVDALRMAHLGLFSHLTLLTSDLDFKPLVDALVDMGIQVTVQYPQGETNETLIVAADFAEDITFARIGSWLADQSSVPVFNGFAGQAPRPSGISVDYWQQGDDVYYLVAYGSTVTLNINEPSKQRHGNVEASHATAALHYAADVLGISVSERTFEQAAAFDGRS
jgi:uncharacterized LabA/DUF88 family protein